MHIREGAWREENSAQYWDKGRQIFSWLKWGGGKQEPKSSTWMGALVPAELKGILYVYNIMHVCMLSHFSHVQFFVTHVLQPSRLLCPWDSPGNNRYAYSEEPGPCPKAIFDHSSFESVFPCLPDQQLNHPFRMQGRSRGMNGACFLQTRNRSHGKNLYQGGPYRPLLHPISFWCTAKWFRFMHTHTQIFQILSIIVYSKIVDIVPCSIQEVLVVYLFYI